MFLSFSLTIGLQRLSSLVSSQPPIHTRNLNLPRPTSSLVPAVQIANVMISFSTCRVSSGLRLCRRALSISFSNAKTDPSSAANSPARVRSNACATIHRLKPPSHMCRTLARSRKPHDRRRYPGRESSRTTPAVSTYEKQN